LAQAAGSIRQANAGSETGKNLAGTRRSSMIDLGIKMYGLDPNHIYSCAETRDKFPKLAEKYLEGWEDILFENMSDYDLGQIVLYGKGFWMGAFLWRRARSQSYPRDAWLGWHASQQAERLQLVIECLFFQPRPHAPDLQPDYGHAALKEAVSTLPNQWENVMGYRPLLADTHLSANSGFPGYFERNGWQRTTNKNPRLASSHWIYELVPDAKKIITAKHLDKAYAGGPETGMNGLLPIPDELLSSFKNAFTKIYDPRESNRHFPQESLLATGLMALISGADSVNSVLKFSTRLSGRQAELLGFPYDEASRQYDLPAYHVYYRLIQRIDRMKIAEKLIDWVKDHLHELPGVLHPDGDVIRDTCLALMQRFNLAPLPPKLAPYKPPIGVDPDAPGGLKRDDRGNLME
jgi:hypothetical protein